MSRSEPGAPGSETGLLNEVVSKLRERLGGDLVAVVLFGSRARWEAHEDSGWDVLVVDAMVEASEAWVGAEHAWLRGL